MSRRKWKPSKQRVNSVSSLIECLAEHNVVMMNKSTWGSEAIMSLQLGIICRLISCGCLFYPEKIKEKK